MLNINKWIYFNFFLEVNIRANKFVTNSYVELDGDQLDGIQHRNTSLTDVKLEQAHYLISKKTKLNICTAVFVAFYVLLVLYYFGHACFGDFSSQEQLTDEVIDPIKLITFVVFMSLAVIYFIVGTVLLLRLKRHFIKLYEQFGC